MKKFDVGEPGIAGNFPPPYSCSIMILIRTKYYTEGRRNYTPPIINQAQSLPPNTGQNKEPLKVDSENIKPEIDGKGFMDAAEQELTRLNK
jgi:hypothetical protein